MLTGSLIPAKVSHRDGPGLHATMRRCSSAPSAGKAATYAASGDFEKALTLQEQAIDVANRDRIDVIDILREHLELFRDGKTVTEKAP